MLGCQLERGDLSTLHSSRVAANDSVFIKYHLGITNVRFCDLKARGVYDDLYDAKGGSRLALAHIVRPNAVDFLYYLQKVGGKYGWDRREKYQKEYLDDVQKIVEDKKTDLFVFMIDGNEAGFCTLMDVDRVRPLDTSISDKGGIAKRDAVNMFLNQRGVRADSLKKQVEIYKIGLFDQYTQQGYGNYFLYRIMEMVFEKEDYNALYLDTRSTNHSGVLKFYEQNGVDVFFEETLQSDLVETAPSWGKPTYHAVLLNFDDDGEVNSHTLLPHL